MFTFSSDESMAVSLGLMSGDHNTDDDYARYVEALSSPTRSGVGPAGQRRVMFLVVDRGNPVPDADWRRKIAAASANYTHRPIFGLVTASPIVRGVATAINWLRPPPYEMSTFAEFPPAVAWAEQLRREPLPCAVRLLREARALTESRRPSARAS